MANTTKHQGKPRNVLVTGAARGIGRAIALRLAEDGHHVAVNDIAANRLALEGLAGEIREKGGEVRR